jgi:hypothetical protein
MKPLITGLALGLCSLPVITTTAHAASDAVSNADIDALKARVEALEKQVSENRESITTTQSQLSKEYQQVATLVRRTINDNASAAARVDNALYGDDLSGFFKLPNTSTVMRIGGYVKVDAIFDKDPTGDPDQFLVSELPTTGADNQFHLHARQTRINFEVRRPTDNLGPLRILIENDFFGSGGSTNFRLRHAYAQVSNVLGGYTYSTFMDADALPNTLDFAGPGGAVFLFTPQLRYSAKLGGDTNLAVAIERPASEIDYNGGPVTAAESTPMPDIVSRVRWESTGGHLQIGAVLREVGYDNGTLDDTVTAAGASISGVVKTVGPDSLQFSFTGGQGVGHYYSDTNGGTSDAAFDSNGNLEALKSGGGFVAYQHYWNERWNSSVVYGRLQVDNSDGQAADALHKDQYSALNLIWNPKGSLNLGVELMHGTLEHKDGSDVGATRIQLSAQVDLVR